MFRTENECMKTCQLPEINPEKNPESNPKINPEIKTEINPEINPKINSEQPVEDVCSLEVDPGSCSTYPSYYYRYYFDINDQKCKMFTFCGYRGKTCILFPVISLSPKFVFCGLPRIYELH